MLINVADVLVLLSSSPARGTWIEIADRACRGIATLVVPRKGDVDRNIHDRDAVGYTPSVVPRKGDVDRNAKLRGENNDLECRPPQGGRG